MQCHHLDFIDIRWLTVMSKMQSAIKVVVAKHELPFAYRQLFQHGFQHKYQTVCQLVPQADITLVAAEALPFSLTVVDVTLRPSSTPSTLP